jgi:alpha-D-ribose 1-methylphosphonate 5-triphosphate synthase subunit PhnH
MTEALNASMGLARDFRTILDAMARPGRVGAVSDKTDAGPLDAAAARVLAVLSDRDAPVWLAPSLRTEAIDRFLRFETGAAAVEDPSAAAFLVGDWSALAHLDIPVGTPEYPDRGATLILNVPRLETGGGVTLTGPGIETSHALDSGLPADFWAARAANHALYPLGWDAVLTNGARLAALPRTTVAEF